jgi:Domain of unknown function DUF302
MTVVPHTVNRLVIEVAGSFDEFRARFEEAVPQIDPSAIPDFVERRAPWDEVVAAAAEAAPHGFLIYWTAAATELMALAGDRGSCVSYLMGNHTIAERMYRHDPAVMLYAPLRAAIYADGDGRVRFAIDQPSTVFDSFGTPEITKVGYELDKKIAALLTALDAPVPDVLAVANRDRSHE